ncbi:glycoside hydrolase family 10 protein [Oribacterium sp. WCC10]|uniref:glycoside hydrolase family 10 protein n=1 Tax=Oribacterium sp. WCC10 TaxID=1855343 RepID=UPI0008E7628D|nr:family 10 glycosylhydrolase [Oribacterium sp. WCC10]SFG21655.1 Uncharacterized lipoprotein YddW, UPF0748 family [Oribacterium sp. WCC10]
MRYEVWSVQCFRKYFHKCMLAVIMCLLMCGVISSRAAGINSAPGAKDGLKGVWFSYINWADMPSDEVQFKKEADKVMENIAANGMNAIFCHVHSHTDAYYKSDIFPVSKFLPTDSDKFDALQYMIDSAHRHGLQFHAWLNPYRVTGSMKKWEEESADSISRRMYDNAETNRNVLLFDGSYYLNPSKKEARDLIVSAVQEVMTKYDVDGVQFDDYFYPGLGEGADTNFDYPEYASSGSSLSIADWRRENVSALIEAVYAKVHEMKSSAVFGVSPVAELKYLKSNRSYFVDIDKWLSSDKYIDYILPQIYFGFEQKTGSGAVSEAAFEVCLNDWIKLMDKNKSKVKLYVGLALYKCNTDTWDGNAVPEWLRYNDILAREVLTALGTGKVSGFGVYAYQNLVDSKAKTEVENLKNIFLGI